MTVLANVSSRAWTPQMQNVSVTPAQLSGVSSITVTLPHPEWPSGACFTAEVFWDGVSGGKVTQGGGPRGQKGGGTLPSGDITSPTWNTTVRPFTTCSVRIVLLQSLTSAILVEGV
jgi:hypothetical protein